MDFHNVRILYKVYKKQIRYFRMNIYRHIHTNKICKNIKPIVNNNKNIEEIKNKEITFHDLKQQSNIVSSLEKNNIKNPTTIQRLAIPYLNRQWDSINNKVYIPPTVAIQEYTGSGKTLAYIIPILNNIDRYIDNKLLKKSSIRWIYKRYGINDNIPLSARCVSSEDTIHTGLKSTIVSYTNEEHTYSNTLQNTTNTTKNNNIINKSYIYDCLESLKNELGDDPTKPISRLQAIIVVPTAELSYQITKVFNDIIESIKTNTKRGDTLKNTITVSTCAGTITPNMIENLGYKIQNYTSDDKNITPFVEFKKDHPLYKSNRQNIRQEYIQDNISLIKQNILDNEINNNIYNDTNKLPKGLYISKQSTDIQCSLLQVPSQKYIEYNPYKQPHIIIGTPMTISELLKLGVLQLPDIFPKQKINLKYIIFDEMDYLIRSKEIIGYKQILNLLTIPCQQMVFVSTTLTYDIAVLMTNLSKRQKLFNDIKYNTINDTNGVVFIKSPIKDKIYIDSQYPITPYIKHYFLYVPQGSKKYTTVLNLQCQYELLKINQNNSNNNNGIHVPGGILLFCSPKTQYDSIKYGFPLSLAKLPIPTHIGISSWRKSSSTIRSQSKILIDSKIAIVDDTISRGIDLPNMSLVINLNVPKSLSTYIHRSGRVGRISSPYRRQSSVITLIQKGTNDEDILQKYSKKLNIPIEEWPYTIQSTAYQQLHQQNQNKINNNKYNIEYIKKMRSRKLGLISIKQHSKNIGLKRNNKNLSSYSYTKSKDIYKESKERTMNSPNTSLLHKVQWVSWNSKSKSWRS